MISVAVQGGAMRSIYCLGAMRALVDGGYAERVRTIHTASAGCVSGVALGAYVADPGGPSILQMRDQLLDRLAGDQFINLKRPWKIVDVDHLADTIQQVTKLSVKTLSSRGLVFEVGMTDAKTGFPKYVDVTASGSDVELYRALRATMAIPGLYPKKIMIDGRRCIDGGISDPLPLLGALKRRPSMIIAISSVASSHLGWELEGGLEPRLVRLMPFVLSAPVKHLLLTRNPLAAAVEDLTQQDSVGNVRIIRIAPADQKLVVHRLETRRERLLALEEMGYQDGVRALLTPRVADEVTMPQAS